MSRGYQLIAALLSGRQLHRAEVARELGIKVAAADKHLKMIEAANIAGVVVERRDNKKYVRWNGGESVKPPPLPLVTAACFASGMVQIFKDTAYEPQLHALRDGLIKRLKKPAQFAEARRKFLLVLRGKEVALQERQGLLDELVEAVLDQRKIELKYSSFEGDKRDVEVTPLSLAIYDHQLYLLGMEDEASIRPYRVSRIQRLKTLRKTFSYPNHTAYDPEVLFRDSFGIFLYSSGAIEDVVLRFSSRWRTFANTHLWHSTHRIISDSAGGVTVGLRVRVCPELRSFILGFGKDVEVLEPKTLRNSIAQSATELARLYSKDRTEKTTRSPKAKRRTSPQAKLPVRSKHASQAKPPGKTAAKKTKTRRERRR